MSRRKKVTLVLRGKYIKDIMPEDIDVCSNGKVAFGKLDKNYDTMKKKWSGDMIDLGHCKVIRKEIYRGIDE